MNAQAAWNVLVALGGASEGMRAEFVRAVEEHDPAYPFEFRFQGAFGFGGKVRMKEGYFQVDYYPEDKTDERQRKLAAVNENLARL